MTSHLISYKAHSLHLLEHHISFFIWNCYYHTQMAPQILIQPSRSWKTECVIPLWVLSHNQVTYTLLSPTLTHYRSETAPSASGSGLPLHQLLAKMNVAQWAPHPPGYLGPTLVGLTGMVGPEPCYRHRWLFTRPGPLWEPGGDRFWRGWWSLFQWE